MSGNPPRSLPFPDIAVIDNCRLLELTESWRVDSSGRLSANYGSLGTGTACLPVAESLMPDWHDRKRTVPVFAIAVKCRVFDRASAECH